MITAKADNRRRVQIPDIKAGQVFAIENNGAGVIVLHELRPVGLKTPKSKTLKDKQGVLVMRNDRVITAAEVQPAKGPARTRAKPASMPKVRFVKRGRYTVGESDRAVDMQAVKRLLAEFP